jgi:nucleotide-binding universal stress UspA family protein
VLSRVLIATDASEASDRMLDCVSDLRKVGGKEALLVHVFDVRHAAGLYPRMRELPQQ